MIVQRENEQNRWKMNNIFVEISEKIGEKGLIFRNIPFIKKSGHVLLFNVVSGSGYVIEFEVRN